MLTLDAASWLVILAALALIGWVNWYFFVAGQAPVGEVGTEATVVVRGGYAPAAVRVRAGAPVRLIFDRQETSGCSEEVVIPAFGVRRFLPAHERTTVELPAAVPGSYEFTCGMGMLRGKIVVE